jgi:hypothetical protein
MALIENFHGMSTSFNLQESYQWVLFADDPPFELIRAQAGARVHRLSVPSPVEAVTHYTPCCGGACVYFCYPRDSGLYVHESCCPDNQRHLPTYVGCRRFWYGPLTKYGS